MASNEVKNPTILSDLLSNCEFLQLFAPTLTSYSLHILTNFDQIWPISGHMTIRLDTLTQIFGFWSSFCKLTFWKSRQIRCPTVNPNKTN